ncbi:MAG: APC family permease [Verrucomicrobiota bacterium]|nr:APC family permease [Verrucomicrobiota bacterium]
MKEWFKRVFIGQARNVHDPEVFHKVSLIAFLAWVGLGSDALSSSCYGPEEAFKVLAGNTHLALIVALASAATIFIISASYKQIVELFPSGGGGYLVASKLLSPSTGMVSACALLIDYVLTITISVVAGMDAIFSFLPATMLKYKLIAEIGGIALLIILNLRGIKESITFLLPIFIAFLATHAWVFLSMFIQHASDIPQIPGETLRQLQVSTQSTGGWATLFLLLKAFSMGAGTFTGIEAVSNGMHILREPKVKTAVRTMGLMAGSLAFTVVGLMIAYVLYGVHHVDGKTLNAVLFEKVSAGYGWMAHPFIIVTLLSEAFLLFIASQTGFIGGPQVLANMAADRWMPSKFTILSDRFVTQNGVLIMGVSSLVILIFAHYMAKTHQASSVSYLIILYSINVFITFCLSQLGMVRYWVKHRGTVKSWKSKLAINFSGLMVTTAILFSIIIMKFFEGGWLTIIVTGGLAFFVTMIKRHYNQTGKMLSRLDDLVAATEMEPLQAQENLNPETPNKLAKTAVLLVNGYSGLGLHTLFMLLSKFKGIFHNFVFIQVGVLDAGNFKGVAQVDNLHHHVEGQLQKYKSLMENKGFNVWTYHSVGTDIVEQVDDLATKVQDEFPDSMFFGGQLVFPKESWFTRMLHNFAIFAVQRRLYRRGILFLILPVRVS